MVRLRYTKLNDGTLVNKSPIIGTNTTYTVQISAQYDWSIYNANTEQVLNGSATTLASAKKAVKASLLALGVAFSSENRSRKGLVALAAKKV